MASTLQGPVSVAAIHPHRAARVFRHDLLISVLLPGLRRIRPTVLSGLEAPKWQDFAVLEEVRGEVLAAPRGTQTPADAFAPLSPAELAAIAELRTQHPDWSTPPSEVPAENPATAGELKRLYRKKAAALFRVLPPELMPKLKRLQPDSERIPQLTAQAESLMQRQATLLTGLFATSGFESLEVYETAMRGKSPEWAKLVNLLTDEKLDMVIRRPGTARWWVPKVGFHNQFVTQTSRGANNNTYRNHCESGFTGMGFEDYSALDSDLKPKYGTLRPTPASGLTIGSHADGQYGEDIYILKKELLRERVTFTVDDSLNTLGRSGQAYMRATHTPAFWDQLFLPWKYRMLLAPFLYSAFIEGKFGPPSATALPETLNESFLHYGHYLEIQIFGPLRLEQVQAFEFTAQPPEGEFLRELQQRGIEIRDGRQWPPVAWTP